MRLLVVEGNTPVIDQEMKALGGTGMAGGYAGVLRQLRPDAGVDIAQPAFPDFTPDKALDKDLDGVVLTGSFVDYSAHDERAAPARSFLEKVFDDALPVFGSCWGLHIGAVVLGGSVGPGPNGFEFGIAREVTVTAEGRDHPLHHNKPASYDTLCTHYHEVTEVPTGAKVTASNRHSRVQAMVFETGGVAFWGVQYHPEFSLEDLSIVMGMGWAPLKRPSSLFPNGAELREVRAAFQQLSDNLEVGSTLFDAYSLERVPFSRNRF